jgi:hypothetical protein
MCVCVRVCACVCVCVCVCVTPHTLSVISQTIVSHFLHSTHSLSHATDYAARVASSYTVEHATAATAATVHRTPAYHRLSTCSIF